jgi:hypothetical protein
MPCASTEGQKVIKNAGKYLGSKKKPLGKKNYSTFPPQTSAHTPCLARIVHNERCTYKIMKNGTRKYSCNTQ